MLYLSSYDFDKNDDISVTITKFHTDVSFTKDSIHIDGEDNIKNFVKKHYVLGLRLVGDTLMPAVYNTELIKLEFCGNGVEVGLKFEQRDWITAIYNGHNDYRYSFTVNGETVELERVYLLMQKVKIDITANYKNEPKKFNSNIDIEPLFPVGYLPEKPKMTKEEIRLASQKRREEREKAILKREENEKKLRAEQKRKMKEEAERARKERQAEAERKREENVRLQEQNREKAAKYIQSGIEKKKKQQEKAKEAEKNWIRVLDLATLNLNYKPIGTYKGFVVYRHETDKNFAIRNNSGRNIWAKRVKSYMIVGGILKFPFTRLEQVKNWINAEFF